MSERMAKARWVVLAVLGLVGCRSGSPSADANSNWLGACNEHADCGSDTACICGLCTRTCEHDAQCGSEEVAATCVDPAPIESGIGCAGVIRAAGDRLCLAACGSDADCEGDARCAGGACWSDTPGIVPAADAGAEPPDARVDASGRGPTQSDVPRAIDAGADLSQFDASFDFDTPVARPQPQVVIESTADAPSLIGVWVDASNGDFMRLRLEIRGSSAQDAVGSAIPVCGQCPIQGPLAPASDPDLGYPVELGVEEQGGLRTNLLPGLDYRMFDGRADAQGFRFWFSNYDVWRDWCALQTPHPIEVDGRRSWSCIAEAVAFDLVPPADLDPKKWLCAYDNSVCRCDERGCSVEPHGAVQTLDLRFEGDSLVGVWTASMDTRAVRFVRLEGAAP